VVATWVDYSQAEYHFLSVERYLFFDILSLFAFQIWKEHDL